jgi:hypothetical protein
MRALYSKQRNVQQEPPGFKITVEPTLHHNPGYTWRKLTILNVFLKRCIDRPARLYQPECGAIANVLGKVINCNMFNNFLF